MRSSARWFLLSAAAVLAATSVARADDDHRREWQGLPLRIVSPVVRTHYDGQTNDLLSAGHGTPALIVTGRSDDILPPNFASRAYVGLNQLREGRQNRVRYVEVKNAQHLDTILTLPPASASSSSICRCTATSSRRWT